MLYKESQHEPCTPQLPKQTDVIHQAIEKMNMQQNLGV